MHYRVAVRTRAPRRHNHRVQATSPSLENKDTVWVLEDMNEIVVGRVAEATLIVTVYSLHKKCWIDASHSPD